MLLDDLKQQASKYLELLSELKQQVSPELVGLDFGADSLKLLKINSTEKPYKVENFSISPLPAGAITKEGIKDQAAVYSALKDVFRQSGVTTKMLRLRFHVLLLL